MVVLVNNNGWNSRWYSGSGIYRHTHLRIVDPVNIPLWGVHVTNPSVTFAGPGRASHATVAVETKVASTLSDAAVATVDVVISTESFAAPAQSATVQVPAGATPPT